MNHLDYKRLDWSNLYFTAAGPAAQFGQFTEIPPPVVVMLQSAGHNGGGA